MNGKRSRLSCADGEAGDQMTELTDLGGVSGGDHRTAGKHVMHEVVVKPGAVARPLCRVKRNMSESYIEESEAQERRTS